jgi:pimeloyl-ACP methyl ester carboxylesterase
MFGAYAGYDGVEAATIEGYDAYNVSCDFANANVTLTLAFDADGKLAGLTVANYVMKASKADDAGGYVEEDIVLRAGADDETSGKLTLPEGEGPFPCVVMMQGSGASGMDVTIAGISIFAELSHMLARGGVASVRYDKYTYAHADLAVANKRFSVDDEYAYDAASAMELLASDARIGDIYLLGHSEGAQVAPRVAEGIGAEKISGMVLIAGSPKPLYEILLRQLKDQGADDATVSTLQAQFDAMWDMTDEELEAQSASGASLYYWRDQADYDYAAKIAELNLPVFIAQGAKDFQVLPAEGIEAYEAALSGYDGATYVLYDDMNHLLCEMSGEMTGTSADYVNLAGVSDALAADIAQWILAR